MYLVREVFHCKPGKVRPLVEKFTSMNTLSAKFGFPRMRLLTDAVGPRYWTLVAEMAVESLTAYEEMMSNPQGSPEDMKQFEELMKGYHDLVDHGHREFYKIEA